jgi:glutathione S-transferase-like protein
VQAQWVLEEGGIEYEFRKIDILKGEHRTPEFLAVNPAGLVPVLITPEGETLYEVADLLVYLANRHQVTELAPAVTDPDRATQFPLRPFRTTKTLPWALTARLQLPRAAALATPAISRLTDPTLFHLCPA